MKRNFNYIQNDNCNLQNKKTKFNHETEFSILLNEINLLKLEILALKKIINYDQLYFEDKPCSYIS